MTNQNRTYPYWINIYLWIATIMALMFSLLAYFKPEIQFGTWEALSATGALSLAGPIGLYVSRNIATALVGIYALTQKSVDMIKIYIILRIITDGVDAIHNLIGGNMQGVGFAAIMFLIEVYALYKMKNSFHFCITNYYFHLLNLVF